MDLTEASADPMLIAKEVIESYAGKQFVYNPAKERQVHFYSSASPRGDIKAGEELLDNFLGMIGAQDSDWEEDVLEIKGYCVHIDDGAKI
jgi:hypothetical protein